MHNMQSLVTLGQVTSEIKWLKKKEDVNDSGKTEWPAASQLAGYAGGSHKYVIRMTKDL